MQSLAFLLVFAVGFSHVAGGIYDYGDYVNKSLLFYQAQRSGKLFGMDPLVSWRKDSALDDKGQDGEDLTGGYYDAGDFVKFGFPMAFTVTMMSWSVYEHESTYASIGALDEIRNAIKWGTDYFIKAHVSENEFYGQVGNGEADHAYWGRPEDMTMDRPAYKITTSAPGSDLAAETAAAMAAASTVFKNVDSDYSSTLITHAKQLYEFADTYRGKYSDSITDVQAYYNSSNYQDELVWGAIWLYRATLDKTYINKALEYYKEWDLSNWGSPFSWDDKSPGATAILAYIMGGSYLTYLRSFCDDYLYYHQRTPKNLIWYSDWGSLRQSANNAFICLRAASLGISTGDYREKARGQIYYMLGEGGRSYVVGMGKNPPTHQQHRAASCPDAPATCDWDTYNGDQENYHVLYGALVGGPDSKDGYDDVRSDYVHNEVACDYNAAFQGALVALIAAGY